MQQPWIFLAALYVPATLALVHPGLLFFCALLVLPAYVSSVRGLLWQALPFVATLLLLAAFPSFAFLPVAWMFGTFFRAVLPKPLHDFVISRCTLLIFIVLAVAASRLWVEGTHQVPYHIMHLLLLLPSFPILWHSHARVPHHG